MSSLFYGLFPGFKIVKFNIRSSLPCLDFCSVQCAVLFQRWVISFIAPLIICFWTLISPKQILQVQLTETIFFAAYLKINALRTGSFIVRILNGIKISFTIVLFQGETSSTFSWSLGCNMFVESKEKSVNICISQLQNPIFLHSLNCRYITLQYFTFKG